MHEPETPTGPELDALRAWDPGAEPLDDAARNRVGDRLRTEIARGRRSARFAPTRRRTGFRLALSGALAAALAATLLVTVDHGAPGDGDRAPGSESTENTGNVSAHTVLVGAAAYERRHEKQAAPRDDQFIYTKEIIKETEKSTGTTKSYTDETWRSVDGSQRSWIMEIGHGWWAPPLKDNELTWPPQKWSVLQKLPTDPRKLLLTVANYPLPPASSTDGFSTEDWYNAHFHLAGLLKLDPVMPPGLRAAAYEALGMVPGVKAIPGQKDAKGRVGVAIVYESKGDTGGFGSWMVFDPKTYAFLGFRDTRTSDGGKSYTQLSYLADWAVTDRAKQRP